MMRIEVFLDEVASATALREEVISGLTSMPKTLSPMWFYDDEGCAIYDEITKLEEYYPFLAERQILRDRAKEIIEVTEPNVLVELGSGNSEKTRFLLDAMTMPATYVPFDVAESTLREAAAELIEEYPGLDVHGIVGDFGNDIPKIPQTGQRLIALLGSTIGNFDPEQRAVMLKTIRDGMNVGDHFLIGTDLQKEHGRLIAAYDDSLGVTARFNLNVLHRLNRELGADFNVDKFRHVAIYNEEQNWIEMRLMSTIDQHVELRDIGVGIDFAAGETMRTEISAKFTPAGISQELTAAGMTVVDQWVDDKGDFLLTVAGVER